MDRRLKVLLPLGQTALAALLLRLSFLYEVATQNLDCPGVYPGFVLVLVLNLPVSLPAKLLLYGRLPTFWFDALFLVATGLFWYGVASWILSCRERKVLFPFETAWMRMSADSWVDTLARLRSRSPRRGMQRTLRT
jgi:hypothetical protein